MDVILDSNTDAHGSAPATQPAGYTFRHTAIAVRCVAAAETYRITGRLPEWAQDTN